MTVTAVTRRDLPAPAPAAAGPATVPTAAMPEPRGQE